MNPTLFLYRFAGPRGPGPFTMKYWWTLGCFPTGREVPFRLPEFLQTYCQMHVPAEVEEWLDYFVKNPAETLVPALEQLLQRMEAISDGRDHGETEVDEDEERGYKLHAPSVAPLIEPLKAVEMSLSVRIPAPALRAVMSDRKLCKRAMDDLYEYTEAVRTVGSTPHRRAGFAHLSVGTTSSPTAESQRLDEPQDGSSLLSSVRSKILLDTSPSTITEHVAAAGAASIDSPTPTNQPPPVPEIRKLVSDVTSVPSSTAPDERRLIQFATTVATGSMKQKKYRDAADTLSSLLLFCHDDDTRGTVHSSLASALNCDGRFREAEFHGREAALLKACPRGYANWAVATAYMDDFERAERILDEGTEAFLELQLSTMGDERVEVSRQRDHPVLEAARASIANARRAAGNSRTKAEMRGKRSHLPSQQQRGLEEGQGRMFDNPFDQVVFNKHLYAAKMDPSNFELGSVFRRVGDVAGFISSTKSMEKI